MTTWKKKYIFNFHVFIVAMYHFLFDLGYF